MSKAHVLGVGIDSLTLEQMLACLLQTVAQDHRALIAHVNITGLNMAYEQAWLRAFWPDRKSPGAGQTARPDGRCKG